MIFHLQHIRIKAKSEDFISALMTRSYNFENCENPFLFHRFKIAFPTNGRILGPLLFDCDLKNPFNTCQNNN